MIDRVALINTELLCSWIQLYFNSSDYETARGNRNAIHNLRSHLSTIDYIRYPVCVIWIECVVDYESIILIGGNQSEKSLLDMCMATIRANSRCHMCLFCKGCRFLPAQLVHMHVNRILSRTRSKNTLLADSFFMSPPCTGNRSEFSCTGIPCSFNFGKVAEVFSLRFL